MLHSIVKFYDTLAREIMTPRTDIVAIVPDYAAEALTAAGGLRAEEPPLPVRSFELHMAWRGSQDNDPGERWLRSRIQMFFGDPESL